MKPIALCIGHSRLVKGQPEGGARSGDGVSEHQYWSIVAPMIESELADAGVPAVIVDYYEGTGYTAAMRWLAGRLRELDAAAAIELHFNSATPRATGHEWLYWHNSRRGRSLALSLDESFSDAFDGCLMARGAKPRTPEHRGAEFLRLTHCPAVIAEPFFGSNATDWRIAVDHRECAAESIAEGIAAWLEAGI